MDDESREVDFRWSMLRRLRRRKRRCQRKCFRDRKSVAIWSSTRPPRLALRLSAKD
jgi:hypothetical protein